MIREAEDLLSQSTQSTADKQASNNHHNKRWHSELSAAREIYKVQRMKCREAGTLWQFVKKDFKVLQMPYL